MKKSVFLPIKLFCLMAIFCLLSSCRTQKIEEEIDSISIQDVRDSTINENKINNESVFSKDEIDRAKEVVLDYYTEEIESIELDLENSIYEENIEMYKKEKENIIMFSIKIKNDINPPRVIILIRENSDSDWKVVNEGY